MAKHKKRHHRKLAGNVVSGAIGSTTVLIRLGPPKLPRKLKKQSCRSHYQTKAPIHSAIREHMIRFDRKAFIESTNGFFSGVFSVPDGCEFTFVGENK